MAACLKEGTFSCLTFIFTFKVLIWLRGEDSNVQLIIRNGFSSLSSVWLMRIFGHTE